jgi:hypothetical protein
VSAARPTALCTLATGRHLELLELSLPGFETYAARHGHELVVHRASLAPDRPPSWSKVVALHELAAEFERVIWIDVDAVVVDGHVDLAGELRPGRNLAMAVHRYDGNAVPNAGVLALRGGRWTRRFLEQVWASTDLVHHRWWENAAMLKLLGHRLSEPVRHERVTPAWARFQELDLAWNSVPVAPAAKPRIVHLAGLGHAERLSEMKRLTSARSDAAHTP